MPSSKARTRIPCTPRPQPPAEERSHGGVARVGPRSRTESAGMNATAWVARPDRAFAAHVAVWTLASFAAYGVVAALIPNPVFGRQLPPEPFAIAVWLLSAPLLGVVGATYTAPLPAGSLRPVPLDGPDPAGERRSSVLGTLGSLGAFLAIGCPICNKLVLLLLGTSGAMSVYAPLQPVLGAASLVLLAITAAWRLRIRAGAGVCPA